MPNTIPAAGEAMSSRRHVLGLFATTAASAAFVTVNPVTAAEPAVAAVNENAELLAAYEQFKQACAEKTAAHDALSWIADEWRHLWPLAPEELLGGANADYGSGMWGETAERDILGNFLKRDTSVLTKRFSAKHRAKTPFTCFSVLTPEEAEETLAAWRRRVPKGRTAKAMEKKRADRDQRINDYARKAALAREYRARTEFLRDAAGVPAAKEGLRVASAAVVALAEQISTIPAVTLLGLGIKAEAVQASGLFSVMHTGIIGELSRFTQAVRDLAAAKSKFGETA